MQPTTIYCSRCGTENQIQASFCFRCGQSMQYTTSAGATAIGQATQGQMLNQRYRMVKLIGQGGMGAVYQAEDTRFGARIVAVKEMSQSGLTSQEIVRAVEQFKQEAQLLASLTHPNLPSIFDYFGENGRWYLVMDFIEGLTLQEYLRRATGHILSVDRTLDIGIQLTKVLGYLHNRPSPIIFRDLKPLNIMITPDEHIYLIDFGIARLFKPGQTKDTISFISAGYAAPEQYGHAQTSPQSDIYSLGATLHQLLSGSDPSLNVPLFTFKPLQAYNRTIPSALANLVEKMVHIDPAQRPPTMAVVRQTLESIQTQLKQGTSPQPSRYTAAPPASYPQSVQYTPVSQPQIQRVSRPPAPTPQPVYQPSTPGPVTPYPYTPVPYAYPSSLQQQTSRIPVQRQAVKPVLPKNRFLKAFVTGSIAGIIIAFSYNLIYYGYRIVILTSIIVWLITGIVIGKIVVLRRWGFFTGIIAGIVAVVLSYEMAGSSDGGLYTTIAIVAIWAFIAGLISLFGAWLATIRHPYYRER